MKQNKREIIEHRFYANGKNVWMSEWYEQFSVEELREKAAEILASGYGDVDIITDSKGRLVNLKEM